MNNGKGSCKAPWRKYARVFALGIQERMEYRSNVLMETLVGLGSFFVILFLWSSIFEANGGGVIAGLTLPQTLTYLLLSRFWDWVQNPGELDATMPEDIRNGGLSKVLVRPMSDRLYRLSLYLAHGVLQGSVRMLPVAVLPCLLPEFFSLSVGPWLLWLPTVMLLSLLLQFLFSYTLGLLAFWFLAMGGLLFLKRIIVSFLAGAWIPLQLLPPRIREVSALLPFQYMVFFPIRLAMQGMPPTDLAQGCIAMGVWIGLFWALSAFLWNRGLHRYSAAGI